MVKVVYSDFYWLKSEDPTVFARKGLFHSLLLENYRERKKNKFSCLSFVVSNLTGFGCWHCL